MTLIYAVSSILNSKVTEQQARKFASENFDALCNFIKNGIEPTINKDIKFCNLTFSISVKLQNGINQYFKQELNQIPNLECFDINELSKIDIFKFTKLRNVGKKTISDLVILLNENDLNVNNYKINVDKRINLNQRRKLMVNQIN